MKTMTCDLCKLGSVREAAPIIPRFKEGARLLFLVDYPSIEDAEEGLLLSGLSERSATLHRYIKQTKLDLTDVSFASVIRCITKSKAAITFVEYETCGRLVLDGIRESSVKLVLAFGSAAARIMTGRKFDTIDGARGIVRPTLIEGVECVVTYALSMSLESGCGSCGKSVYPFLIRKDIESLVIPRLKTLKEAKAS